MCYTLTVKIKICETCQQEFNKANFKKWCSEICYEKRKNGFTSGGSIIGNCLRCNERVLKFKSQIVSGNIFCNSKCSNGFYKKSSSEKLKRQVQLICENCNLEFSRRKSAILNRDINKGKPFNHNFCSKKCKGIFESKLGLGIFDKTATYTKNRSSLELFLEEKIKRNFPFLLIDPNNRSLLGYELDLYLPEISLAIEVNGIHHHKKIYKNQNLEAIQFKDSYKIEKCKELNIQLIIIPFIKRLYLRHFEQIWKDLKLEFLNKIPFCEPEKEDFFDFKIKGIKQLRKSKSLLNKITSKNAKPHSNKARLTPSPNSKAPLSTSQFLRLLSNP